MNAAHRSIEQRRLSPGLGAALFEIMLGLRRDLLDRYRPERHYMRGPGPAWHAKHAGTMDAVDLAGAATLGVNAPRPRVGAFAV